MIQRYRVSVRLSISRISNLQALLCDRLLLLTQYALEKPFRNFQNLKKKMLFAFIYRYHYPSRNHLDRYR